MSDCGCNDACMGVCLIEGYREQQRTFFLLIFYRVREKQTNVIMC